MKERVVSAAIYSVTAVGALGSAYGGGLAVEELTHQGSVIQNELAAAHAAEQAHEAHNPDQPTMPVPVQDSYLDRIVAAADERNQARGYLWFAAGGLVASVALAGGRRAVTRPIRGKEYDNSVRVVTSAYNLLHEDFVNTSQELAAVQGRADALDASNGVLNDLLFTVGREAGIDTIELAARINNALYPDQASAAEGQPATEQAQQAGREIPTPAAVAPPLIYSNVPMRGRDTLDPQYQVPVTETLHVPTTSAVEAQVEKAPDPEQTQPVSRDLIQQVEAAPTEQPVEQPVGQHQQPVPAVNPTSSPVPLAGRPARPVGGVRSFSAQQRPQRSRRRWFK